MDGRRNNGRSDIGGKTKDYYVDKVKPKWEMILMWARSGLSDGQIAENCGIAASTFSRFLAEHEELRDLVREGRDDAIIHVENALFKRAVGYSYVEVTKELRDEKMVVTKRVRKEMAPDVGAATYWLEQRAPKRWTKNPMAGLDVSAINSGIQGLALLLTKPVPERAIGSENE